MRLSVDEVRKIARLARLRLTPEEEQTLAPQLGQIIGYFDQLLAYDSVEQRPSEAAAALEAEDEPRGSMPQESFLDNAPEVRSSFLLVPQIKVTGRGDD